MNQNQRFKEAVVRAREEYEERARALEPEIQKVLKSGYKRNPEWPTWEEIAEIKDTRNYETDEFLILSRKGNYFKNIRHDATVAADWRLFNKWYTERKV